MKGRGLRVPELKQALHWLTFVSYYRLGPYARALQLNPEAHEFQSGASFDDVLDLYVFDRDLRLFVMAAVERIEVAVRSVISNYMALKYGHQWLMDQTHFSVRFRHNEIVERIERAIGHHVPAERCSFIAHYYSKYSSPEYPPCWMIAEVLSLGLWSQIYSRLERPEDRKAIARKFNLNPDILQSWLHSVSSLRNLAAHHLCLWNHRFVIKPATIHMGHVQLSNNATFYGQAAVVQTFLRKIEPSFGWAQKLAVLFEKHPRIPIASMGFVPRWDRLPFWGLSEDSYSI